jgi:hypothetical protein
MLQIGCGTVIAKKKLKKKFHGKFFFVKMFYEIAERSVAISEYSIIYITILMG